MKQSINDVFKSLQCGEIKSVPFVVLEDGEKVYPEYKFSINEKTESASLKSEYKNIFSDSLYFDCNDTGITVKRMFENISENPLCITELGFELNGIYFDENTSDDYFYHNENPRIYSVMTFPVDCVRSEENVEESEYDVQAGNRWADPGVVSERIGAGPYQAFPAILISNYNVKRGLVHGSLRQNPFFHNYLITHIDNCVKAEILSSVKAIKNLKLESGRVVKDEWYIGKTDHADDIEKIFSEYTAVLRKKIPSGYGRSDVNRTELVWGTWNDGIFRDVSEDLVVEEMQFLKEHFPTVKWIQLDDGYTVYNKMAHSLGAYYEGIDGIDYEKFPGGLRQLCDKITDMGFRPALWIGGFCPKETLIYKEHPEWFVDYNYRISTTAPLDVSIPEVREYMKKTLDFYFNQCGFEGIKHDFWSYAFEDSHNLLKNNDCSGYEYRKWWLSEIRAHLPGDGYLETACDIGMGNPFMGEYVNNYRYGMDIGTGKWDNIKTNYQWGIANFATHTGDLFIPNSDGVGFMSGLNETDRMFYINYCLVTHSMVELAGRTSRISNENDLKLLKKAVCNPNNGQDVYFAKYDYRQKGFNVPEIIYFKTPHFSRAKNNKNMPLRTIGLFNPDEECKNVQFNLSDIDLPDGEYVFTDVWTLEQWDFDTKFNVKLPSHGSMLLTVSRKDKIQIFDSNIRINAAIEQENMLVIETDYKDKNAELYLSKIPVSIKMNGRIADFKVSGKIICIASVEKGKMEIIFK